MDFILLISFKEWEDREIEDSVAYNIENSAEQRFKKRWYDNCNFGTPLDINDSISDAMCQQWVFGYFCNLSYLDGLPHAL